MKYDKIVAMNQAKSKQKADIAIKQIEKMLERKERISVTALAQNTGFAKSFFYRNPEVRKALGGLCLSPPYSSGLMRREANRSTAISAL